VATRKQRRRREKEHRHEYEVVYLDDEGNEVEPQEPAVRGPARPGASGTSRNGKGGGKGGAASRGGARGRRAVQPPSWKRVARRGALFFPLFVIVVFAIDKSHSLPRAVFQGVILFVFFVPFSYFLDAIMWRSTQKKAERGTPAKR